MNDWLDIIDSFTVGPPESLIMNFIEIRCENILQAFSISEVTILPQSLMNFGVVNE